MSIKSVMPSNHLILCRALLLQPSISPSIRVFSNESVLRIRWPKDWGKGHKWHLIHSSNQPEPLKKKKKWSRSVMSDSLRPHGQYAYQAPPSMGFSRQEYWGGLPFPSPGNLPDPGIIPRFPALQADTLPSEPPGKPQHHCTGLKSAHCPQPASYFRVSPHAPAFLTRLWTSLARDIACSSSLYSLTENLIYSRQNDQAQDNVMKH